MKLTIVLLLVTLGLVCSAYAAPTDVQEQLYSILRPGSSSIQDYNDDDADAQFLSALLPITKSLAMPLLTDLASNLFEKVDKRISIQDNDEDDTATQTEALLKSLKDEAEIEGNANVKKVGKKVGERVANRVINNLVDRGVDHVINRGFEYFNNRGGKKGGENKGSNNNNKGGNRGGSNGNGSDRKAKAQMFSFIKRWLKWIRNKLCGRSTTLELTGSTEAPAILQNFDNEAEIESLAKLLTKLE